MQTLHANNWGLNLTSVFVESALVIPGPKDTQCTLQNIFCVLLSCKTDVHQQSTLHRVSQEHSEALASAHTCRVADSFFCLCFAARWCALLWMVVQWCHTNSLRALTDKSPAGQARQRHAEQMYERLWSRWVLNRVGILKGGRGEEGRGGLTSYEKGQMPVDRVEAFEKCLCPYCHNWKAMHLPWVKIYRTLTMCFMNFLFFIFLRFNSVTWHLVLPADEPTNTQMFSAGQQRAT